MTIYFDNAATTRVCDEAADAVMRAMQENYGNPSSSHLLGRTAKKMLDSAREAVAAALNAAPEEVFFASGGTEADNWAILGAAEAARHRGRHIITTEIEHDAIRKPMEKLVQLGAEVTWLEPDKSGRIRTEDVLAALRSDTVLVSIMLVNNETGAINPIREIAEQLRIYKSNALLHTDAVQAFCKMPFSPKNLGADLLTVSSHKIHGPKGAGALYIRRGVKLPPRIMGGGQEREMRSGTEALPAICGFGEAAKIGRQCLPETERKLQLLRNRMELQLKEKIPDLFVVSQSGAPHILSISLPGYKSEVLMNWLDSKGIYVSKSSACKKGGRSHVLEAMKLPAKVIDGAIRISFSRDNTVEEVDLFVERLAEAAKQIYKVL